MPSLGSDEFTADLVSQSIPQSIDSGFDLLLLGLDFGNGLPSLKEFEPNLAATFTPWNARSNHLNYQVVSLSV